MTQTSAQFQMLSSKQNQTKNYHQCDSVHNQEGWYLPQKKKQQNNQKLTSIF